MMKFECIHGIATWQYMLFTPHGTWLPIPPTLHSISDGCLPGVEGIQRDPLEWVGGEMNMVQCSETALTKVTMAQKERSLQVDKNMDLFQELATETAADMLDRFTREENGIFALQKRMALPAHARNKDILTRQNTAQEGFIVWLQDTEEREWRAAIPQPITPEDIEVTGDGQGRKHSAAHDIDTAARNILTMVTVLSIRFFPLSLQM
jgi:hypothetical protein